VCVCGVEQFVDWTNDATNNENATANKFGGAQNLKAIKRIKHAEVGSMVVKSPVEYYRMYVLEVW
jgi:hypothetical protein